MLSVNSFPVKELCYTVGIVCNNKITNNTKITSYQIFIGNVIIILPAD